MDNSTFLKLIKQIKPGKPFDITYKTDISGTTAAFKKLSGGCTICKMTGATTVTGLEYNELDDVKQAKADKETARNAAKNAGEEVKDRKYTSYDEQYIPNTVTRSKKNPEDLYLLVYPSTYWKTNYKNFNIFGPDGECQATYENVNDIREYLTPSEYAKRSSAGTPDIKLNPVQRIKVANIFDLNP